MSEKTDPITEMRKALGLPDDISRDSIAALCDEAELMREALKSYGEFQETVKAKERKSTGNRISRLIKKRIEETPDHESAAYVNGLADAAHLARQVAKGK